MKKFFVLAVLLFSVSAFADPAVLGRFECYRTDGSKTNCALVFEKNQYALDFYFIKSVVDIKKLKKKQVWVLALCADGLKPTESNGLRVSMEFLLMIGARKICCGF